VSIDLAHALTTTRTVRRGLDYDRPVDRDLIRSCLDLARFAPNGANRQNWRFLVVDDRTVIGGIAACYRKASAEYLATSGIADTPTARGAAFLADRIDHAPALVLGCLLGRLAEAARPPGNQRSTGRSSLRCGASCWPPGRRDSAPR